MNTETNPLSPYGSDYSDTGLDGGRSSSAEMPSVMEVFLEPAPQGPDGRQKQVFGDLLRLYASLRGPESVLDRQVYSRPFPPAPKGYPAQPGYPPIK